MDNIHLRLGGLPAGQEAPGLSASKVHEKSRSGSIACFRVPQLPVGFSKICFLIIAILLASVAPASSACTLSLSKSCAISDASGIFVDNDIAYVATSGIGELVRVNIGSSPMQVIGRSNTANPAYDVFVSGGRAYITEGTEGIEVVDSTSGAHLGSCTGWSSIHFAMGIYASGSYAYVGTSDGYLVVLNLANPNSPSIANTIATHDPVGSGGGLCVYSNNIYLATDTGVEVYTLGNPTSPSYSTTLPVPGGIYDVHVFDGNAYVEGPSASPTVQIRSLSNWGTIANCYQYTDNNVPYAIQFYGGKAYIADTGGVKELALGSGSITISLDANIETSQTFGFDGDLGSFILDDNSDTAYPNTKTFGSMQAGNYIIHQIVPTGWALTGITATGASQIQYSIDGNIWRTTFTSGDSYAKVTVQAGNSPTVTFADSKLATISGHVIYDLDGSGTMNDLESYVANGWKLELYKDSVKIKETTTSSGAYSFSGLASGSYEVRSILPSGWSNTLPANGIRIYPTLPADQINQEFGARGSFSISGTVFRDFNGDGAKNGLDAPVSGKTVQLFNTTSNSVIAQCTSGTDGSYQFSNIAQGSYSIKAVATSGWQTTNSPITLTSLTGSISNQDLGLKGTLAISGIKFQDKNGNGQRDTGEAPLSGWTIYNDSNQDGALQSGELSDVTDSLGIYNITNLIQGSNRIAEVAQSGWEETTPAAGYHDVILTSANVTGKDFGNIPSLTVAKATSPAGSTESFTFQDTVSSGDSFLLTDQQKKTFSATPGTYTVTEDAIAGWKLIDIAIIGTASAKYGSGTSFAHDAFAAGDTGVQVTLDANEYCILTFNNSKIYTISGLVWDDQDYDGLQDSGEPALSGVSVELLDQNAGSFSPARTNSTNAEGKYSFAVTSGSYRVRFTLPSGRLFSPADLGGDDSLDSDANPSNGQTAVIILSAGVSSSVQDAGVYENRIVINEIYPNPVGSDNTAGTPATWERVELKNTGSHDCSIDGWMIKDDDSPYILATIPSDTIIDAGGYLVFHIGGSSQGISNGNGDPVNLTNSAGVLLDSVSCPASSSYEGLSYSCLPDATENWGFWGEPTLGGDLSSASLLGAVNMGLDLGDAPDTYSTTRSQNGPRHFVTGPLLGLKRDYETNGQPGINANGDDTSGEDDEDGATFPTEIIVGLPSSFNVTTPTSGILQAWIDFNGDGDFADTGEHLVSDLALPAGEHKISFTVPADAKAGYTYARLRFSSASGLSYTGLASDGEVEDYRIEIKAQYLLGDLVWEDLDADGLQDSGEPGLNGVTVNLWDGSGGIAATNTTVGGGFYSFVNPSPGTYTIEFGLPAGYNFTAANAGSDDAIDSDVNPDTHRTSAVTVVLGQSNLTLDAGLYRTASISGVKFNDKNESRVWDAGEPGLSGWTVYLDQDRDGQWDNASSSGSAVEPSRVTDSSGGYSFSGLVPGSYRVREVAQNNWAQSCPAGSFYDETLVSGQTVTDQDFGNHVVSGLFISGKKTNETGVARKDWNITLTGTTLDGTAVSLKTKTAADGNYSFTGLLAGSYTVTEEAKAGWQPVGFASYSFDLTASKTDVDFVNQIVSGLSVSGRKTNQTGAGKGGWNITLTGATFEGTAVSLRATTANDGSYSFTGLSAGSYTVAEEAKAGWQPVGFASYSFDLTASKTDVDFVNQIVSGLSVSGKKTNQTGAGKGGWNITLTGATFEGTAVSLRATTANDGSYSFTDLSAGSYTVAEEAKDGWVAVGPSSYSFDLTASKTDVNFVNQIASGLSISGKKTNQTGAGKGGWNIALTGATFEGTAVSLKATTASDGSYSFTGLSAGSYAVAEEAKEGWQAVGPSSYSFDLTASKTNVNFVNRVVSGLIITGKKTNETDVPKMGWNITLTGVTLDGTAVLLRATTASDGSYSFTGLSAGSYTIAEEARDGWQAVSPASYTLVYKSGSLNVDFVNRIISGLAISGHVVTDKAEPKSGWNITLAGTTLDGDPASLRTTTASDGSYSFTGLLAGDYTVACESRAQWPVINPATGYYDVSLRNADSTDNDFEIMFSSSISGSKFEDKDGDRIWDAGEPGLGGWTITLERAGWANNTTTTSADGNYSFEDLPEGSYVLSEVEQDDWTQTAPKSSIHSVDVTAASVTGINFGNRRNVTGMTVDLTASPNTVLQGESVILTTTVNGAGSIKPDGLSAEQLLPSGLALVSATPQPDSTTANPDGTTTIIWSDLPSASAASSAQSTDTLATMVVQTTVNPDASGILSSNVSVSAVSSQAIIKNASASTKITVRDQLLPVTLTKASDLDEVAQGGYVTYTIGYESNVDIDLTGVIITEHAPSDLEFISATPAPDGGTENIWTLNILEGRASGEINILYRVKNRANVSYESASQVTGVGYVNVRRSLSTETDNRITNSVTLSCNEFAPVSTSLSIKLLDSEGTTLLEKEHGSGEYKAEELMSLKTENRSIRTEGSLKASYRPTSFALPGGRSLEYDSLQYAAATTKNRATSATTGQSFGYAKSIDLDRKLLLDKNETDLTIEANVQGQSHLGALKNEGPNSGPVFEASADYRGSFSMNSSLEDYGSSVRLAGNTTGTGSAGNDMRLRKSQRSYEHGSGSYQQEEMVSTPESYIAKDVNASYSENAGEAYGNSYGKWTSGMWSKSSGNSFVGQEISGADYIREETLAGGLSDMETNASFRGQGRFRAVSEPDNRSQTILDETYVGEYSISRKVHLGGVSHFDRPHITLLKEGRPVEKTSRVDYHITVLNDGNAALGPVYVWDPFPAGTDYVSASIKPTVLKSDSVNWTLLYLGIGQMIEIDLQLNITDPGDALVNRVYASGGHNDEWTFASNMSVLQAGWLGCCPKALLAEMQARIDSTDSKVIWYRIYLQNPTNQSIAAQVTTELARGLSFLNASIEPQQFGESLSWVTDSILPGESRIIEYRARALSDGRFVSTATVMSQPLDGSDGDRRSFSASITVGNETSSYYPEDGWRPPEWGLDRSDIFDSLFDSVAADGDESSACEDGSCPV